MEYIIVFIILLFGVIRYRNNPEVGNKWLMFEWLVLVLLAGLRYRVGGDSLSYEDDYDLMPNLATIANYDFVSSRYNVLWVYFVAVCKSISREFYFFQIVHAIIVNTIFFWFFKKHTKNVFLAVLLYSCFFYFKYNTEILRASLAVCCFLLSYDFLKEKKYIYYIGFTILAIGFHSEAIYMAFFPFVEKGVSLMRTSLLSTITLLGFFILSMFMFNYISFFSNVVSFSDRISENLDIYTSLSVLGKGVSLAGYLKTILWAAYWLVLCYKFSTLFSTANRSMLILHSFAITQSINYSGIFYRAQDFTIPICIAMLVEGLSFAKQYGDNALRNLIYIGFIMCIIDLSMYMTSGHIVLFYPYHSIFNPVTEMAREVYYYGIFGR